MSVPFHRIAISQGLLDDHTPLLAAQQTLTQWAQKAQSLGADSLMLRELVDTVKLQPLLQHMNEVCQTMGMALLANIGQQTNDVSIEANGVHHKSQGYYNIPKVRKQLLGRSCHSLEEAMVAQDLGYDYISLSPVFRTLSHPAHQPLGIEQLHRICSSLQIPVFALGGVTLADEGRCLEAGAWGIAGIRCFL